MTFYSLHEHTRFLRATDQCIVKPSLEISYDSWGINIVFKDWYNETPYIEVFPTEEQNRKPQGAIREESGGTPSFNGDIRVIILGEKIVNSVQQWLPRGMMCRANILQPPWTTFPNLHPIFSKILADCGNIVEKLPVLWEMSYIYVPQECFVDARAAGAGAAVWF